MNVATLPFTGLVSQDLIVTLILLRGCSYNFIHEEVLLSWLVMLHSVAVIKDYNGKKQKCCRHKCLP